MILSCTLNVALRAGFIYLYHTCNTIIIFQADPIVAVKQGKLKGSIKTLLDGKPYYSFKGIRYGEPPVGKLRFKVNNIVDILLRVSIIGKSL